MPLEWLGVILVAVGHRLVDLIRNFRGRKNVTKSSVKRGPNYLTHCHGNLGGLKLLSSAQAEKGENVTQQKSVMGMGKTGIPCQNCSGVVKTTMQLTVKHGERSLNLEVELDELVENLKAIIEVETNVPLLQQKLYHKDQEVQNHMRLRAAGVHENAVLTLVNSSVAPSSAGGSVELASSNHWSINPDGSAADPVELQKHLRADPVAMAHLQQRNPEIARAVLAHNIQLFQQLLREQYQQRLKLEQQNRESVHERPSKRQHHEAGEPSFFGSSLSQPTQHQISYAEHELMYSDPFDVDAQRRIEEYIRQKNVDENWEAAIEHNPEAFARVVRNLADENETFEGGDGTQIMLYVDMEVNGVPLKAFVDTGAQSTIISISCAERCGLLRLLDRRYVGIAKGVGQSMIVGRIHVAPLKIGRNHYPCSFMVLEHADIEFIFGLDMLRKHQCVVDLKNNVLNVGGGEISVPFLQEAELPGHLRDEKPLEGNLINDMNSNKVVELHPPAPVHAPCNSASSACVKGTSRNPTDEKDGDAKVQRLVDLGFDRNTVLKALSLFNGNEDQAASYLFGG